MAKLKMQSMPTRKKILPLVMTLANKIMKDLRFTEVVDESIKWEDSFWNISPGNLLKVLVLSTFFDIRTPLTHLEDRFENIDLSFFVGEEAYVNSSNVGRALERLGEADYNGVYETLALSAMHKYDIESTRYHSDTTTISFYGEYDCCTLNLTDEEQQELLQIEKGYNKDGRPSCKQVVVGQVANELGIPVVSKTMNGATSDVEWNKQAIQYFAKLQEEGFVKGIYVADCKLVTEELITMMTAEKKKINFISRCPANFAQKLEDRMIERAYQSKQWEDMGQLSEEKDASHYRGISYIETICDTPMRLLVLESSSLAEKAEKHLLKEEEKLKPLIRELEKKLFKCEADAQIEIERFKALSKLKLFNCVFYIEKKVKEKYPVGRKKQNAQPEIKETFHIRVQEIKRNEKTCIEYLHRESSFVLISNVIEEVSNHDLLKTYKGQQVVENSFRLLKGPSVASVIYLKNPQRIQALSMILTFSLLIRAIIQYLLREGLKKHNEENPDIKLQVGWGNRPLISPTYKLFFEHAYVCCFEREGFGEYSFAWPSIETKLRVATLLDLMGLTLESLVN